MIAKAFCEFLWCFFGFYKETAFGFLRLFLLSQWGIPHRSCRFNCSLRGHQRTETADSADPAFSIRSHACVVQWTPTLPPNHACVVQGIAAAGHYRWPRGLGTIWFGASRVSWCRLRFRIFCWASRVFRFLFVLMKNRRCLYGLNRMFFWLPLTARVCPNIVLLISGCFLVTEYRRLRGFVSQVFLILVK